MNIIDEETKAFCDMLEYMVGGKWQRTDTDWYYCQLKRNPNYSGILNFYYNRNIEQFYKYNGQNARFTEITELETKKEIKIHTKLLNFA